MKKLIFAISLLFFLFMACKPTQSSVKKTSSLQGTWELNYITGPRIAFDGLYPNKKPILTFDLIDNKFSGNNSCNQYFGTLKVDGNAISFERAKMGMTMMACLGEGEKVYNNTLEKINFYSISEGGKTLNLMMGDIAMMRFEKN